MSNYNPLISNGTCYFSADKRSDQSFIPCGNDALGRVTCCGVGDNCLGNRACFNGAFGLTYLAGCTDPEYKDDSCPDKGNLDESPWTGLVYCNGTSNQWMACEQSNKPSTLRKGDFCFCPRETESRRVVFSAPSTLVNVASLPPKISSSIRFENGFVPTQPPGQTTVTLLPPTGTGPANNSPQETNPADSQGEPPSGDGGAGGLSTGAKAGIGAGVGAVALMALAALVLIFMRRRKQQAAATLNEKHPDNGIFASSAPHHGDDDDHFASGFGAKTVGPNNHLSVASSSHGTPSMMTGVATPNTPAVSELDSHAARPWSMRSELPGSDNVAGGWESQQKNAANTQPVTPVTPEHPPPAASHYPGFRPYRPPGDPLAANGPVSPVPGSLVPGGGVNMYQQQGANPQQQSSRPGALSPVHELP
ncbi:hypothetical protein MCOR34_000586 [Pyricularia oryzae]|nr:hypothetical protein MCOR34_000586 [Pyricularia oryzae]